MWIIKKNIKFRNCSFNFKQTFSNLIESIRGWFAPIKKKLKGKEKKKKKEKRTTTTTTTLKTIWKLIATIVCLLGSKPKLKFNFTTMKTYNFILTENQPQYPNPMFTLMYFANHAPKNTHCVKNFNKQYCHFYLYSRHLIYA